MGSHHCSQNNVAQSEEGLEGGQQGADRSGEKSGLCRQAWVQSPSYYIGPALRHQPQLPQHYSFFLKMDFFFL